jgi:hypothetical protein
MQATGGAILAWVVIAFVIWQLFRFLRKHAGGAVAVAVSESESEATASGGAAQAGVIVNVYLSRDPRHGTVDDDGAHISVPAALDRVTDIPSLPHGRTAIVAPLVGKSGDSVRQRQA